MGHAFIAGTVLFTVYGQLVVKLEVNRLTDLPQGLALIPFMARAILTRPLLLSGLVAAFIASLCWLAALSKFQISYALPFMALNFVLVVGLSIPLLGETPTVAKVVGLALICTGVLVVAQSSSGTSTDQVSEPVPFEASGR